MSSPARRAELKAEHEARQEIDAMDRVAADGRRRRLIANIRAELENSNLQTVLADMLLDPSGFIESNT